MYPKCLKTRIVRKVLIFEKNQFLSGSICREETSVNNQEAMQRGLICSMSTARETVIRLRLRSLPDNACCLTMPLSLARGEPASLSFSLSLGHCSVTVLRFHSVIRRQLHTNNSNGQCRCHVAAFSLPSM